IETVSSDARRPWRMVKSGARHEEFACVARLSIITKDRSGSGQAPRIAPSMLVSINSKSKTTTDCATVGPQLTNNKAHNVTRYDRMIMVSPLGPSARARVPWSGGPLRITEGGRYV